MTYLNIHLNFKLLFFNTKLSIQHRWRVRHITVENEHVNTINIAAMNQNVLANRRGLDRNAHNSSTMYPKNTHFGGKVHSVLGNRHKK